jgi:hypothetical protein
LQFVANVRHPHLLELSTLPWLERLSRRENRPVRLGDVPAAEWDAIAARGFDLVFLMGVWSRSRVGRQIAIADPGLREEYSRVLPGWTAADVAGSPYCVRAYEPGEEVGGWEGLETARAALRARGLGLVLDFVPNHLAFDHDLVRSDPELFVLGTRDDSSRRPGEFREIETADGPRYLACGRDPHFPAWTDVAQLNVFNPRTRSVLIEQLARLAACCDGVRADMAMLVTNDVFERTWRGVLGGAWPRPPGEFWVDAIRHVPNLLYLAEVYWDLEWSLQQQGFHYTYDKRLLDRLEAAPTREVRGHLLADASFADRLARFLENHDEPRSAAVLGDAVPAAATMLATLPGLRFFFDGQLEGRRVRTPVQLRRWPDEPPDRAISVLYDRLLATARAPLFHAGAWALRDVQPAGDGTFDDLIAYRWRDHDSLAVVVVNFGASVAQGHVQIAVDLPPGTSFDFADRLADQTWRWTRADLESRGLYVRLESGRAHLFLVTAGP